MDNGTYRVQLRRTGKYKVKSSAEQIDGWTGYFMFGWEIDSEESTLYGGECAMIPRGEHEYYPLSAPAWIASGDLVRV